MGIDEVIARLEGRSVPRGRAGGGIRGTPRGGFPKPTKRTEDVLALKPNLSFEDSRSVNALSFAKTATYHNTALSTSRGGQPPQVPKPNRPTNYNQGFVLASPEDFLAQSRASTSAGITTGDEGKNKVFHNKATDGSYKPQTAGNDKSVQLPHESPTVTLPVEDNNGIAFSAPVQVANQVGAISVTIGPGIVRIKPVENNKQDHKIIQIEYLEKIVLEEPLVEGFEFKVDSCSVSFQTDFEGQLTKWVLTPPQPWIATDLAKALGRVMPQSPYATLADTSTKDDIIELAMIGEAESLISLTDEGLPPEPVSQHTQDLLSLWKDQLIEEAAKEVKNRIDRTSSILPPSSPPVGQIFEPAEVEDTKELSDTFRGPATSDYATETDSFFSKSATFRKLPDNSALHIKEQVSQRVFEVTRKDISDQGVLENAQGQLHIRYTIEELMSLKNHPNSIKKPYALHQLVDSSATEEARHLSCGFNQVAATSMAPIKQSPETSSQCNSQTTRLGVRIVSDLEKPQKLPGLASSRYASSRAEKGQLMDSKSSDSPRPEPFQDRPNSKEPSTHALKSFQAFVSSQNGSSPASKLSQGLTNPNLAPHPKDVPLQGFNSSKTLYPPISKPFQGLASSKYASPHAVKSLTARTFGLMPYRSPKKPAIVGRSFHSVIADVKEVRPLVFPIVMEGRKEKDGVATTSNFSTSVNQSPEAPAPALGSWNSLRRRDSFNSHASKNSTETVKPVLPMPTVESIQGPSKPVRSSVVSGHQSMLSFDSSVSAESFATAIEEKSIQEEDLAWKKTMMTLSEDFYGLMTEKPPTSLRTPTSEFILFPDDVVKPEAVKPDHPVILPYTSDMSELIEGSSTGNPPSNLPDVTLATTFKPLKIPTSRKPIIPAKRGLMSSRYATANEDIPLGALRPQPQLVSTTVSKETKNGSSTQRHAALKPTASQFTPSIGRGLTTPTPNMLPSLIDNFPAPMQPVTATVLVHDPLCPGLFREVSGLLKMGSTPIVGYVAAENSPMGQNLALRNASVNNFAPPEVQAPMSRPPLSPLRQKTNVQEVRQNVQQRLKKSLAQPRLSHSPNPVAF